MSAIFDDSPDCRHCPSRIRANLPPEDSSPLCIKSRQAPIYAHFRPIRGRRQLRSTALKVHGIRTSRNPHFVALALTLLRTGELESALKRK